MSYELKQLTQRILKFRNDRKWQQFNNPKDEALSLVLEAAEVLELFQWKSEKELEFYAKNRKQDIAEELCDVLYWILLMSHDLDIDLVKSFHKKMIKNEKKYPIQQTKNIRSDKSREGYRKFNTRLDTQKIKIFIAGSMYFAKQMLEAQEILKTFDYETEIPADTYECLKDPELNMDDEHCFSTDIMRNSMDKQKQCEAILVLNYSKNGLKGYIGGAVLIEMGLAYFLGQKIFLLYSPPSREKVRYSQEILHMKPIILNGDLKKIKEYL